MPPSYITIPRGDHEDLLREIRRGVTVCDEIGKLKFKLQAIAGRLSSRLDKAPLKEVGDAIEMCEEVSRLRIELAALHRRLGEFDQELTPIDPSGHEDARKAFENSIDFARGRRKPTNPGFSGE